MFLNDLFSVGARAPTSGVQRRMKSSRSQTIGMGCWRLSESKVSFFAHNHFTANKIFYCDPQQSPQLRSTLVHLRSKKINLNSILGVVHLGQIQSGLRAAIRIVQGSHIKIHMNSDVPVQVIHYFYQMTEPTTILFSLDRLTESRGSNLLETLWS